MTVMVEALVRSTPGEDGRISNLEFGIIEWPFADLDPKQVLLVERGLSGGDQDPMYLIALMEDDESMFDKSAEPSNKKQDQSTHLQPIDDKSSPF